MWAPTDATSSARTALRSLRVLRSRVWRRQTGRITPDHRVVAALLAMMVDPASRFGQNAWLAFDVAMRAWPYAAAHHLAAAVNRRP